MNGAVLPAGPHPGWMIGGTTWWGEAGQARSSLAGDMTPKPFLTTRHTASAVLCVLVLGSSAACGNEDDSPSSDATSSPTSSSPASSTTADCRDAQDLRTEVDKLTSTKLGQGTLAELSSELTGVQDSVQQLAVDASDQYATQVDDLKSAAESLKSSLQAVTGSPSAAGLRTVGADMGELGDATRDLGTALSDTC